MTNQRVHCPTCLHEQRWSGDTHEVVNPGGKRRPDIHPQLAAWRVLLQARTGGPAVVAVCPCGLPLVGDHGTSIAWELALPNGIIDVGSTLSGPAGTLTEAEVTTALEAAYRERIKPVQAVFQTALLTPMILPFLLWALMLWTTAYFLYNAFMSLSGAQQM